MFDNIKQVKGMCESCARRVRPEDLYVDIDNVEYLFLCKKCFYSKYSNNVEKYYTMAKRVDKRVYSEKEFKEHMEDTTVIGYGQALILKNYMFLTQTEKDKFKDFVLNTFLSDKVRGKFRIVNLEVSENHMPEEYRVAYKATVKFKTYLEYLEHHMYMKFRKEIDMRMFN